MQRKYLDSALAARFRDEIFSTEEQMLLRTVVGSTYIDIADQLLHHYGKGGMRTDNANDFIKASAVIKYQKGLGILEQLALLNKELENLMNPILNYSTVKNSGWSDTNMTNDTDSKSELSSTAGSFGYEFTESSSNTASASLSKGAVSQTSQQNKQGLENKGRKHPLIDIAGQLVGKKEFDPNKILQKEKVLDVREAHYEIIAQEEQREVAEADLYSTMNLSIVGDKGTEYTASNNDSLSLTRSDSESTTKSDTTTTTHFTVDKTFTQYVANEATMKSLRLRIPRKQQEFFNLFQELFQMPFI